MIGQNQSRIYILYAREKIGKMYEIKIMKCNYAQYEDIEVK